MLVAVALVVGKARVSFVAPFVPEPRAGSASESALRNERKGGGKGKGV